MAGLIGKKIGMTSLYDEKGNNLACTVIQAGPCVVTQIKNSEKDGYDAVQIGFDDKKERLIKKSEIGHFKNSKQSPKSKLMEFSDFESELKVGDTISADLFVEGEYVDVTGVSKGKGFQGVVKRHGFAGVGDSTHCQNNRLRAPGSIGAGSSPSRVFKGMRMAGQTGNSKVKVLNLSFNKEFEYTIVSEEESDLQQGKISVQSPIGKGLLGKKKGEEVSIDVPSGELKFKILNISL